MAPSNKFVKSLPLGKIPDRKDFITFKGKDAERKALWQMVVEQSKVLGDEFFEAVQSEKIAQMVTPAKKQAKQMMRDHV
ncbi:hypothetical protein [Desulfobacula sp.]|uniref:hypothetical protein n=1 Tax=Desulfobacula sp. TaxID=2593537 RepID=UPI00261E4B2F|nr:hypothetical protein [Desulfobacula sp.]